MGVSPKLLSSSGQKKGGLQIQTFTGGNIFLKFNPEQAGNINQFAPLLAFKL
jgi:hypothetical protein